MLEQPEAALEAYQLAHQADPDNEDAALPLARRYVDGANYEAAAIAAHLDLIDDRFAPREALVQTKKHLARYAAGWSEARTLRGELFAQPNTAAARALFARWAESSRPDEARPTSAETQQQQQQQQQSA